MFPDREGYLTGYPLPDGRYALARTWPALDQPRPNCVWTHTLIFRPEHLVESACLTEWVGNMHRHPLESPPDFYTHKLEPPLERQTYRDLSLDSLLDKDVGHLCAGLYSDPRRMVWLEHRDPRVRDSLALAVLSQLWTSARRTFAFCSGALEPRRLGDDRFDLCLVPTGWSSAFRGHEISSDDPLPPAVVFLANDLRRPDDDFRSFLHFVASGNRRRAIMQPLARLWMAANTPLLSSGLLREALEVVETIGPRHNQARRLKRALFRQPGSSLLNSVDPSRVLEAVASLASAGVVDPEDVAFNYWVLRVWELQPETVLGVLDRVSSQELRLTMSESVASAARPSDTTLLAQRAPDVLLAALGRDDGREKWCDQLATLSPSTLGDLSAAWKELADSDVLSACVVALARHDRLLEPLGWREFVSNLPFGLFLQPTVAALAEDDSWDPGWRRAILRLKVREVDLLAATQTPREIATVADLVEPSAELLRVGIAPWSDLVPQHIERLRSGLAVVFLAYVTAPSAQHTSAAASVYALLHQRLAAGGALDAGWAILRERLEGDRDDWDRCMRLARTLAKAAKKLPESSQREILTETWRLDMRAGAALATAMSPKKGKWKIFGFDMGF